MVKKFMREELKKKWGAPQFPPAEMRFSFEEYSFGKAFFLKRKVFYNDDFTYFNMRMSV